MFLVIFNVGYMVGASQVEVMIYIVVFENSYMVFLGVVQVFILLGVNFDVNSWIQFCKVYIFFLVFGLFGIRVENKDYVICFVLVFIFEYNV